MQIHNVVQNTVDWHLLRSGKPTASMFGKVISEKALLKDEIIREVATDESEVKELKKMKVPELEKLAIVRGVILSPNLTMPKSDYPFQLAAEILAGYDCDEWLGNNSTDHGHESEMYACKAYFDLTGIEPKKVGFVTNDNETIGCSPDAFIGESGLLEIKSPSAKNVIKYYFEWLESNECPPDFKMQIQGQLMITEREWVDLVLYHPKLDIKVIRILPDFTLHTKLKEQLDIIMNIRDKIIDAVSEF